MDTKHIHCMLEKMAEYGKCMIEEGAGSGSVCLDDAGKIIDIIKDLACAEKDALIAKEMRKAHEEEDEEEKYMMRMLKDEFKDEYKRMKDEYGEDEGERRFYDSYRYKRSGRFAPKGKGSYMPRRGYDEPHYYHMTPEMMKEHDPEYWRDVDRKEGRMYFTEPVRMDGMREMHDRKYGKSWEKRRGYMETKELHKDGSPESKQHRMKELDAYMNELNEDMKELIADMTPEERSMVKQKVAKLVTLV